jgi:outer membrane receptor protein involved in Fe transport
VAWTKVPRDGLSRVELVPGGGATAWGNAALGGVVQLLSVPATGNSTRATAIAGDRATRSFEFSAVHSPNRASVQLSGRIFATGGVPIVGIERRGPIDIAAWNRHRWLQGRVRVPIGERLEASVSARTYNELRSNGTPYTRNSSQENFGSVTLAGHPTAAFDWNASVYVQEQTFTSRFSAVDATRSSERPANNQFAVPADAAGAAWTGTWRHGDGSRTTTGGDWRTVTGETRERYFFVAAAGDFSRLRVAGGKQEGGGVFALHERPLTESLRAIIGARVDWWKDSDGHRRESSRATGVASRDENYAPLDGNEFSPSAGLVWTSGRTWRVHTNVQRGYRRPTLNELYRPFRIGANVTEANAALRTEQVTSGEIGAEWMLPGAAGTAAPPMFTLGATAFWNDLRDAVGNVTLYRGPGRFPIVGFISNGAVGRQRLNLDRVRVQGVELSVVWRASDALTINADYLYNDATVRRASVAPALVGNRVAQVPRINASFGATWQAPGGFTIIPRVRWIGRQFEDDENLLTLEDVTVVDLGISRPVTANVDFFINLENLGNVRIETGRRANGLINIGVPRLTVAGFRGTW